jgi:hypothetical protein
MPEGELQKTFDWMQESAEVTEGIKIDEEQDYQLTLAEINPKVVTTKKGDERKVLSLIWEQEDLHLKFKMDVWVNDRERVNPTNPELESANVVLARKLGYNPVLGGKFSFSDFLRLGMQITARLPAEEFSRKDGTKGKMHQINPQSIVLLGGTGEHQGKLPDAPSKEVMDEIKALGKGCKTMKDLTGKINKAGAKDPSKFQLLQVVMSLNEQGALKFPMA